MSKPGKLDLCQVQHMIIQKYKNEEETSHMGSIFQELKSQFNKTPTSKQGQCD